MHAGTTLLLAAAVALAAPAARGDDVAEARAHFRKGTQLYRTGRYAAAIAEFEAAYRAKPAGAVHFNVAQARERLGDHAGALRAYRDYLREVPDADDRAAVRATMHRLERKLAATGVQALLVSSDPPGADVTVDGRARGRTPLVVALPPGPYAVAISRPGFAPVARAVTLAPDAAADVDVALRPELPPVPPVVAPVPVAAPARAAQAPSGSAPPATVDAGASRPAPLAVPAPAPSGPLSTPPPGPPPRPAPRPRVFAWVAAGAAALALGAAAYYGVDAAHERAKLRDGTVRTTADADALVSAQRTSAQRANVLGAVGGGLAVASGALFVLEGRF